MTAAEPGRAACADALELVDAAFERSGSSDAHHLRDRFCTRCPIANACLAAGMANGELGVWGGASVSQRMNHGAPSSNRFAPSRYLTRKASA